MLHLRIGGAAAAWLIAGSAMAATAPLADDARAFGAREGAWSIDISPSGSKILYLTAGAGRTTLAKVVDVASGQSKTIIGTDGKPESLQWCGFASDQYLVCGYGGQARIDGVILGFSRLMALGSSGGAPRLLGQPRSSNDAGIRQVDGQVIDWLSGSDGAVLMAREYVPEVGLQSINAGRKKDGLGVDRIDLATLKSESVEPPRVEFSSYTTDGLGQVRLVAIAKSVVDSQYLNGVTRYRYREERSSDWKDLGQYDQRDGSGIYPLAVEAETNAAYVLKKLDGRDALYRMKLDGSRATSLVASDARFDIDGVIRPGKGRRVIGYTLVNDRTRNIYFDPEYGKLATGLGKALPAKPLIHFSGSDRSGDKQLIFASADIHPGTYYLLDRKTKQMLEVAQSRPLLANRKLATVTHVTYPVADGTHIPAYVTLPSDRAAKNLGAVVLPHGGPSSRDEWGFDWLAQFFAARGYAVIQPNYRGSAGYGDKWMNENGWRGWQTSIGDVTSAARYLVAQGIADPGRLAIVGWSYGGYAALQSAAVEPALYNAVVAIAPVTDLALLKKDAEQFTSGRLVKEFVGSGPHVTEGSPLRRVASITAPVLLVHGDMDGNVGIGHSVKMADALRAAGKTAEFVRFDGLDHQLDDSEARVEMLTKIGALLDRTIGK